MCWYVYLAVRQLPILILISCHRTRWTQAWSNKPARSVALWLYLLQIWCPSATGPEALSRRRISGLYGLSSFDEVWALAMRSCHLPRLSCSSACTVSKPSPRSSRVIPRQPSLRACAGMGVWQSQRLFYPNVLLQDRTNISLKQQVRKIRDHPNVSVAGMVPFRNKSRNPSRRRIS